MRNLFKKNKRVLIFGDYNCTTGFAVVVTNILTALRLQYREGVEFDVVAINWYGDRLPDDYEIKKEEAADIKEITEKVDGVIKKVKKRIVLREKNLRVWSAYHSDNSDTDDIYGRNAMLSMLKHFDFNLLFMVQDLGVVSGMLPVIRQLKKEKKQTNQRQFKVMYYFPLDGAIVPLWFKDFDVIDRVIAYTEYARTEVSKLNVDFKMGVILHGVDTDIFKPLATTDVQEFREAYFGANADKYIITNINRNQHRKDIPTTIFGFKEYKQTYNNKAFLYLHMNPNDLQGWNLYLIMQQCGLVEGEDYMFMPPDFIDNPPPQEFLNCIYNASNLFLTTTTGEGFGLTILEAMAAGVPVLAPNNTSIPEIIGGDGVRGNTMNPSLPFVDRADSMVRSQVHFRDVAACLHEVYQQSPEKTMDIIVAAEHFALDMDWFGICKRWIDEFKKLL